MKKEIRKKIENVCSKFLFELNIKEKRNQLVNSLEDIGGYNYKDSTTMEDVDNNFAIIDGYNEKTNKFLRITIKPA